MSESAGLIGRVAIVSGAARGIGAAIARELARAGANVVLGDVLETPLAETVRGFKEILEGKHDDLPETALYLVGTIDQAIEKAKTLK